MDTWCLNGYKTAPNWPPALGTAPFQVEIEGQLEPRISGEHTFLIYGAPAELVINGQTLLTPNTKAPRKSGARFRSKPIHLTAGQKVDIQIKAQRTSKQALFLSWESPVHTAVVVPSEYLYSAK